MSFKDSIIALFDNSRVELREPFVSRNVKAKKGNKSQYIVYVSINDSDEAKTILANNGYTIVDDIDVVNIGESWLFIQEGE